MRWVRSRQQEGGTPACAPACQPACAVPAAPARFPRTPVLCQHPPGCCAPPARSPAPPAASRQTRPQSAPRCSPAGAATCRRETRRHRRGGCGEGASPTRRGCGCSTRQVAGRRTPSMRAGQRRQVPDDDDQAALAAQNTKSHRMPVPMQCNMLCSRLRAPPAAHPALLACVSGLPARGARSRLTRR